MSRTKLGRAEAAAVTADQIVDAALTVLTTDGLDAVTMRRVAAELGTSPIPVYNRIGDKEALLDAMAARVTSAFALPVRSDEHWTDYARRWCHRLRERRLAVPDNRLMLRAGRGAIVAAAEPLIGVLRAHGIGRDRAVETCRLLMWSILGHVVVEMAHTWAESESLDTDRLFALHVDLLVDGLAAQLR